ncbi:Ig-like domain-containing protein [Flavobacterium stagni]|uniref:T9SS type B sorting domain-containing protein n=1 Tax=Flavobacterium stagni TaxID=2506421 RepID=A0A4Q1KBZ2_9FLAO|nr:T9SS type B sorting domain-containing protein [Flavobacterium stagni]RXR24009.1 T9SS type B sorting domain-containing protein [Flavobacterium stagni]
MSRIYAIFLFFYCIAIWSQTTNVAPVLQATGNQPYCAGTSVKIATSMTITDPDDLGVNNIFIQISNGYVQGQDLLTLTGIHPNLGSSWDATAGKLTLFGITGQPTYTELTAAILDVEFSNNSPNPSGTRSFSISVGDANYLPSTGHFYLFVPNLGITWTNALALANSSTYFGLHGYLATLTSLDEAVFSGNQASGTGWIGASDEQVEGQWKWMSGPELGTALTFTYWNTGEPNNLNDEDYAHITAPGVGLSGSWNDLSNTGASSGSYQPKGYIVEFGGMPGDPVLQISTSTSLYIPQITATTDGSSCGPGTVNLQATTNQGTVNWYTSATGGTPIATGNSFTTPLLNTTTTFYTVTSDCLNSPRTAITATINDIPVLSVNPVASGCSGLSTILSATTTAGVVRWYASMTSTQPLFTGNQYTTPVLNQTTTFYVEADNNGCISTRIPVTVTLLPTPNLGPDETINVCANRSASLAVFYPNATYSWSNGSTTPSISVTQAGVYQVTVTSAANCADTKTFTVNHYPLPELNSLLINGLDMTVFMVENGDFEYSIDGVTFQTSPIFHLDEGGFFTLTIREIHGCGLLEIPFQANVFPAYFTPNQDGINDSWSGKGLLISASETLTIYDRYGKIVFEINPRNPSWNGQINGQLAPADDYWFVYENKTNGLRQKGHFALKR